MGASVPSQRPAARMGAMRVLLVEDEERLAAAVARGLRAEGFDVDVTHDGLDGLWRAQEGSYAVIVLDIMLPGMNGYEICRTLRREGVWTPILMLTAKDGGGDEAGASEPGADDYTSNPFSFGVLVAGLRALARRRLEPRPAVLSVDDLVLDPSTHGVRVGEVAIDLTPREFALLEALMRRAGDVIPKQELLDQVWGIDFDGDPNVLEVYMGYLRRKVDKPFGRNHLQTVRGVGSRLAGAASPRPPGRDPADAAPTGGRSGSGCRSASPSCSPSRWPSAPGRWCGRSRPRS